MWKKTDNAICKFKEIFHKLISVKKIYNLKLINQYHNV